MAVAFDAFTALAIGTGDRNTTHTPVGTPAAVYAGVITGTNASAVDACDGITYGGVAMTEPIAAVVKTSAEALQVHAFKLESGVPSGAQTVSWDIATAYAADSWLGWVLTVTAGGTVEVVDIDNTINSTSATNPSVTLSHGGRTCFDFIIFASGQNAVTGITPLTGWTSRLEDDFGGQTGGVYTYDTVSTADVTAGWTQAAEDAVAIAIAISEVVAAGSVNLFGGKFEQKFIGKL